jgi:hypothetical protein
MSVFDVMSRQIELVQQYSEIWDSHKGTADAWSLQGCGTVSLRFEGTKKLRKLSNYSSNDTALEFY